MTEIKLYKGDCLQVMKKLPSDYYDILLVDPPYEYLKHKLDKVFDEKAVLKEWDRILKNTGFIILFGRGMSFYRWNVLLNDLGWEFKEEVIWDKLKNTSPVLPLMRVHETISILSKQGHINKTTVPYVKAHVTPETINNNIKSLKAGLNQNNKAYGELLHYLETNEMALARKSKVNDQITFRPSNTFHQNSRIAGVAKAMIHGKREADIMSVSSPYRSHRFHPTQKPTELLERLLKLVVQDKDDKIIDTFMGSGSTGVACADLNNKENTNYSFTGIEIDDDYFKMAQTRIDEVEKHDNKYL